MVMRGTVHWKQVAARLLGSVLMAGLVFFGLVAPAYAEAVITRNTYELPESFLLDSACAAPGQEEEITVNLTRVVSFMRVASEGGNFHVKMSEMWKNVSAVGVSSGQNYQVHFRAKAVTNTGSAARVFTSTYDMKVVGPNGDSNVYTYSIHAHYTINADGTLANYIYHSVNECR